MPEFDDNKGVIIAGSFRQPLNIVSLIWNTIAAHKVVCDDSLTPHPCYCQVEMSLHVFSPVSNKGVMMLRAEIATLPTGSQTERVLHPVMYFYLCTEHYGARCAEQRHFG